MTRCVRISRLFCRDGIERDVVFKERDGLIISRTAGGSSIPSCDEIIEINGIGFPLFVNGHTHLELTGMVASGEPPRELWNWIMQVVKAKRALPDDGFRKNMAEGAAALVASGTAVAGDVRSVLPDGPFFGSGLSGRIFFELLGYNETLFESKMASIERFLNSAAPLKGLSVHSLYTTPFSKTREAIGFARKNTLPVMIHLAETVYEDRLFFANEIEGFNRVFPGAAFETHPFMNYADIMEYLGLGPDTILVHCTRFSEKDWISAAEKDIPVVLCPRSNRFWGSGLPDFNSVIGSSIRWAIGTDSTLTTPDLDVLHDARFIYRQTGRGERSGMSILNALTYGGRDVLNISSDGLTAGEPLAFAYFPFQSGTTVNITDYVLGGESSALVYPAAAGEGGSRA